MGDDTLNITININGVSQECSKVEKRLKKFKESRCSVIKEIRQVAATVRERQKNVNIARISGSVGGVVGGIIGIVGLGLTIASLGAAFPLVIAGISIAGAGGVTTVGAGIILFVKEHFETKEVKKQLEEDEKHIDKVLNKITKLDEIIAEQVHSNITKQELGEKMKEKSMNALNKYVTKTMEDLVKEMTELFFENSTSPQTSPEIQDAFGAGRIIERMKKMVEKIKEALRKNAYQEHESTSVSSKGDHGSNVSRVSTLRKQITKIETLFSLMVPSMKIISSQDAEKKTKEETFKAIDNCVALTAKEVECLLTNIDQCEPCEVIALGMVCKIAGFAFFFTSKLLKDSVGIAACIVNLSARTASLATRTGAANAVGSIRAAEIGIGGGTELAGQAATAGRVAGAAARLALPITAIVFSSVLLVVDISTLMMTSIDVHKGNPSEVADMLECQARNLEESLQDLECNIDKMFQQIRKATGQ